MPKKHACTSVFVMVALMFFAHEGQGQTTEKAPDLPLLTPAKDIDYSTILLAVTVNGLSGDPGTLFLEDDVGQVYAPASFLNNWNLRSGDSRTVAADGLVYFNLARI
jgi:hypothetical protein